MFGQAYYIGLGHIVDGERHEETAVTLTARMIEDSRETRLTGLPISDGVALGKVCLFREHRHESLPEIRIKGQQIAAERRRLNIALEVAREQLEPITSTTRRSRPEPSSSPNRASRTCSTRRGTSSSTWT